MPKEEPQRKRVPGPEDLEAVRQMQSDLRALQRATQHAEWALWLTQLAVSLAGARGDLAAAVLHAWLEVRTGEDPDAWLHELADNASACLQRFEEELSSLAGYLQQGPDWLDEDTRAKFLPVALELAAFGGQLTMHIPGAEPWDPMKAYPGLIFRETEE